MRRASAILSGASVFIFASQASVASAAPVTIDFFNGVTTVPGNSTLIERIGPANFSHDLYTHPDGFTPYMDASYSYYGENNEFITFDDPVELVSLDVLMPFLTLPQPTHLHLQMFDVGNVMLSEVVIDPTGSLVTVALAQTNVKKLVFHFEGGDINFYGDGRLHAWYYIDNLVYDDATCTNDIDCTPTDACHTASCNMATSQCVSAPAADGTSCDDGAACTTNDACTAGVCSGAPVDCSAPDSCHLDGACDPTSGQCTNAPKADGDPCDDNDACTTGETCMALACVSPPPSDCTPLDECHAAGMCNPATGTCSNPALPDGTACTEGVCQGGVCMATPTTATSGNASSSGSSASGQTSSAGQGGSSSAAGGGGSGSTDDGSSDGCGCRVAGDSDDSRVLMLVVGAALAAGIARRRRRARRS